MIECLKMSDATILYANYFHELMHLFPSMNDYMQLSNYKKLGRRYENALSRQHIVSTLEMVQRTRDALDAKGIKSHFDRVLRYDLDLAVEQRAFPFHLMPMNHFENFIIRYMEMANGMGIFAFQTDADFKDFMSKTVQFADVCYTSIENMKEGVVRGYTIPKCIAKLTIRQLSEALRNESFKNNNVPDSLLVEWDTCIAEYLIRPTIAVLAYLGEYVRQCRHSIGVSALQDGAQMYQFILKRETTVDGLTADAIHRVGVHEVQRIRDQMESVKRQFPFQGTLNEFSEHLRRRVDLRFLNEHDVMTAFRTYRDDQWNSLLDRHFDARPSRNYELRRISPPQSDFAPGAYYTPGDIGSDRPGTVFINTHNVTRMLKSDVEALSLHEGNPGHHYQLTLMNENPDIPMFVKIGSYSAYVEGWALYAERFGTYCNLPSYYGKLESEMLRAIRLVLDTGIHAYGWSFHRCRTYFRNNSGMHVDEIDAEISRYIANPGQAVSYKVGELFISDMRRRFSGDDKTFHCMILKNGSCPLSILSQTLESEVGWERTEPSRKSQISKTLTTNHAET
jgi:uncharacterized protein (DUF885 family)